MSADSSAPATTSTVPPRIANVPSSEGADEGTLAIRGGTVPVVAGAELSALIPTTSIDHLRERISADPHAAFPPIPGSRVGTLIVSIPGHTMGSGPLTVSPVPPTPA